MYIRNRMTTDLVTITPTDSISLAFQLMMERGFSQIPVVDNKKLVGLVTDKLLTEVTPSKATSLSMYELNYLLSKTKVRDIMMKDMVVCSGDFLIEDAAVIMRDKDINSLPVVTEDKTLLGIITSSDIMEAFIELMGVNDKGTRIALEVKDELGTLADISSIISDYGINITHVTNFLDTDSDNGEIIIRLNTTDVDDLVKTLESKGYHILSIKKN